MRLKTPITTTPHSFTDHLQHFHRSYQKFDPPRQPWMQCVCILHIAFSNLKDEQNTRAHLGQMQIQMRNVAGEPRERQLKQKSTKAMAPRSVGQNPTNTKKGPGGHRTRSTVIGYYLGSDPIAVTFFFYGELHWELFEDLCLPPNSLNPKCFLGPSFH